MRTYMIPIKLLLVVLSLETIFAKNAVHEVIRAKTEDSPEVKKFYRTLIRKARSLNKDILTARKKAVKRQRRERDLATSPDMQAVQEARENLNIVQQAIARLEMTGAGAVDIKQTLVRVQRVGGRVVNVEEVSSPFVIRTIDRENASWVLARARQALLTASQPRPLPPELRLGHRIELQEYETLKKLGNESKTLCLKVLQTLRELADKPELLSNEMQELEKVVNESIEDAYDVLEKVRSGDRIAERIEPTGSFTGILPPDSQAGAGKQKDLVVALKVPSEWFIPSKQEYRDLRREYRGLSSSHRRTRVCVFDLACFKLISEGWQKPHADAFIDPHTWGGEVIVDFGTGCIIGYSEAPPPTIEILVGWVMDEGDCTPPFSFQLANCKPVSVPDSTPGLPPSEEPSGQEPSARGSSKQ